MKQGLILVEGQTEETFCRDVLAPHLRATGTGLHLEPKIVATKRVMSGGQFKGGVTSYAQVSGDVTRLLGATNAVVVTTQLDYYALPSDFPGMRTRPSGTFRTRVAHVETEWANAVSHVRFLPHLMLHEFEAMLFASPADLTYFPQAVRTEMERARAATGDPEAINERRETSPSHRITGVWPGYKKVLQGNIGVLDLGLPRIRSECQHFDRWLRELEALAQ